MHHMKLRQVVAAWMVAMLLLSAWAVLARPVVLAAPAAQTLQAQEVAGTLTGGQFAKIWLGLTPETRGQNMTIITEWDRNAPGSNGLGFYILSEDGLRSVLSGAQTVAGANLAAGTRLAANAPDNQLGAVLQATGTSYTIVLYNDSATDASFELSVTNAVISDDSGQVRDLRAAPTAAATEEAAETPAPAETATPAETAAPAAATPAPAAAATVTATATPAPAAPVVSGVVRAQELSGELPEQNTQHYFELDPDQRDANIILTLSFDPQDSSELARRLNFWVLDDAGFRAYTNPGSSVVLSEIAIAAGSSESGLQSNQRIARFRASGTGAYVVIVYNNSNVAGSYTIDVVGGVLVDDSNQSLTAQRAATASTAAATTTAPAADDAATTTDAAAPAATTAPAAPAAGSGREGEPGGTYTVQAGDSLSLIARDVYGDLSLWDEICAYNSLTDCNNIEVGQTLQLPTRAQIGAGATAPAPAAPAPAATATPAAAAVAAATPTATVAPSEEVTATETVTGTATAPETAPSTTTDESAASVNLVEALRAQGTFSILVQALEAAGLASALQEAGPFTIFAPTDAAFAELPAGALDQLLANPTGQLTQILLFHVLPGKVMAADVQNGMQATTQQGKAVTFEVAGGAVKVNGANVTEADIEATNGVIHAIDAVILPPPD
jgi:uncharacterized surface protein with fasciclin (FAS1) repeats